MLSLEEMRIAAFMVACFLYVNRRQDDTLPVMYLLVVLGIEDMTLFVVASSFMVGVLIYEPLVRFFRP